MLVNTETKDSRGRTIYANKLTGKTGILSSHQQYPSQRQFNRHPVEKKHKNTRTVKTNQMMIFAKSVRRYTEKVFAVSSLKAKQVYSILLHHN